MTTLDIFAGAYELYRKRTLGVLDQIAQLPDGAMALGWRPGPGRAHIAWQLMHIAATEDIFASERLAPDKAPRCPEVWARFRGGSTPDDVIPTADEIRAALEISRANLLDTLKRFGDDQLGVIPEALKARSLTILDVAHILGWHEAHHQGQAHLTLNLYRNRG